MHYHVRIVGDSVLPEEQDFAFLECEGEMWVALKRSRIDERVLEDAWATYRKLAS